MFLRLLFVILLFASPALAVDPACEDPTPYDPASGPYNATDEVRFCTPLLDEGGATLADGDLTMCQARLKGTTYIVAVTDPGIDVHYPTPDDEKQGDRFGDLEVWCTNAVGDGASAVASAMFRGPGLPGLPTLLPR